MAPPRRAAPTAFAAALALIVAVAACSNAVSAQPAFTPDLGFLATSSPTPTPTATPTPAPTPTPTATPDPTATPKPTPVPTAGTWIYNVYDTRAVRWQDPDRTACVAASALIMLNMVALWRDFDAAEGQPNPRPSLNGWTPTTSYAKMEELLAYQRKTGTMLLSDPGSDAHGWRNSMNYYGWGDIEANVYRDMTFTSFEDAARATVLTLATYRKPVGVLGWAGDHAQIISGYKVRGDDPRTGLTNFTILGVYLTDPLKADGYRNYYVPLATWKSGSTKIRFTPYKMTNSPYKDPIDGVVANTEWYGKWVIVAPVA